MNFASQWLGLSPYDEALQIQRQRSRQVSATGFVLGCEHPSVITLGKRAQVHIELRQSSIIPVIQIDRGGHATLHSPGQLVIYPILPLRQWQLGIRDYIQALLEATARLLRQYHCVSFERPGLPGLYTEQGKIAFVGVRVQNGVSLHGLSLNIANDLTLFRNIRSCGQEQETFAHLATTQSLETLFAEWTQIFAECLRIIK